MSNSVTSSASSDQMTTNSRITRLRVYPLLVWFITSFFIFYKFILEVSPSVLSLDLMQAFHLDGVDLGILAGCYYYSYLLMQIPVGLLIDKFGLRRLATLAVVVCAVGVIIFSYANSLIIAELGRLVIGLGAAFAVVSAFKSIALWFAPKRFALMSGLTISISILGAVAGQAPLANVISLFHWRSALFWIGIIGLGVAVLIFAIVRDKSQSAAEGIHHTTPKTKISFKDVLKNSSSWLIALYGGLGFAPALAFAGLWGVEFVEKAYHLENKQAAVYVSLVFIGVAVGSPLGGFMSDFFRKRRPFMWFGSLLGTICFSMALYVSSLPLSALAIVLFFAGLGVGFTLVSFAMIKETNQLVLAATAVGFMNFFNSAIGAISDPLIGRLLDIFSHGYKVNGVPNFTLDNFRWALSLVPIYMLVSATLVFFIKETHCKQVK